MNPVSRDFLPFTLQIPQEIYDAMLHHAATALPAECCGLLAGVRPRDSSMAVVTQRYPLINELASPTEFRSEPKSMFAAMKAMRQLGTEVLAVYHSHPVSAPIPSKRDLERNFSSEVMNLIIGWPGNDTVVRAWWLTATNYQEAIWQIEPSAPQ